MGVPAPKWSREQKDAITSAYLDRGIRPRRRILELAREGSLTTSEGAELDPFDMPDGTAAAEIRDERKRRAGRVRRDIATKPPRDAIEQLRQRLVSASDLMLDAFERSAKSKPEGVDPERLRQIARAVREVAALPGPNDPRPTAPGSKQGGTVNGAKTTKGADTLAGRILAEADGNGTQAQGEPLRNAGTHTDTQGQAGADRLNGTDSTEGQNGGEPGSLALSLAQRPELAGLA